MLRLLLSAVLLAPVSGQGLIDHARLGTATQATTGSGGVASRGIDGSTEGTWSAGSVTHTTNTAGSWWEVALAARHDVLEIVVHNRSDCCGARLSNFRVSLFDGVTEVAGADFHTAGTWVPAGGSETLLLPPATAGDSVRITLLGLNAFGDYTLSVAAVEVLGPSPGLTNLAAGGVATQSTTTHGGTADLAIDGWVNGMWTQGSITHTDTAATNSWWEVDLAGTWRLAELHLFNRGDCCWTRLSNYRVSVFSGAGEVWGQDYFVGTGSVDQHGRHAIVLPGGTYGDRVRVELLGTNNDGNGVLALSEVVVLGGAIGKPFCWSASSSLGEPVWLAVHGTQEVARNDLTLSACNLPRGQPALAFYGPDKAAIPAGDGTLCISPGFVGWYLRLGAPVVAGADGQAVFPVDLNAPRSPAGLILPGSTWCFQVWFKDAGGAAGYSFSDAYEVMFQ
jgi:hypothetical protein